MIIIFDRKETVNYGSNRMPFTALYKEDTINSLLLEPAIWDKLKASEKEYRELKCPECEEPMVARAGEGYKIRPHFAHRYDLIENPEGDRKLCSLKSESAEHLYIKQWIFDECQELGLPVEIEKRIPTDDGFQIADICVPDKNKIVEVQISNQSEEKYYERHDAYNGAGYETLWITWKKDIIKLPYARISLRSKGIEQRNKRNIRTAEQFWLKAPAMYFSETKDLRKYNLDWDDMWGYNIDTVDRSIQLPKLIETFMFDIARYEVKCPVCHKPHWCGERCVETKSKIEAIIIARRRAYINWVKLDYPEVYKFVSKRYRSELGLYLKGKIADIQNLIEDLIAEEENRRTTISIHGAIAASFKSAHPESYAYLERRYNSQLEAYLNGEDTGIGSIIDDLREEAERRRQREKRRVEKERLIQQHNTIVEKEKTQLAQSLLEVENKDIETTNQLVEEQPQVYYPPNFVVEHDLSIYSIEDFRKHFDGTEYNYSLELELKYTHYSVYESARIAHENRMLNLKRSIPPVCQEFLDTLIRNR